MAQRSGVRARPGLPLRPAHGRPRAVRVPGRKERPRIGAARGAAGIRCSIVTRRSTVPAGVGGAGLLSPLRHRDFRVLWTGMAVSLLGDGIFLIAVAWEAYSLWNAPTALALVGIGMTVPTIVFLVPGGVVSDRLDRRAVMLAADAVRAASPSPCSPRSRSLARFGSGSSWRLSPSTEQRAPSSFRRSTLLFLISFLQRSWPPRTHSTSSSGRSLFASPDRHWAGCSSLSGQVSRSPSMPPRSRSRPWPF